MPIGSAANLLLNNSSDLDLVFQPKLLKAQYKTIVWGSSTIQKLETMEGFYEEILWKWTVSNELHEQDKSTTESKENWIFSWSVL